MKSNRPKIITVCGSTKFKDDHLREIKRLSMEGNIVLSCPFFSQSDPEDAMTVDNDVPLLEELHNQRIMMSDAIFVVNTGGYIGESTLREIKLAISYGKEINYMEEPKTIISGKRRTRLDHIGELGAGDAAQNLMGFLTNIVTVEALMDYKAVSPVADEAHRRYDKLKDRLRAYLEEELV